MLLLSDVRLGQLQRQRRAGATAAGDDGAAAGSPAVKGEGLVQVGVISGGPGAAIQCDPDQ